VAAETDEVRAKTSTLFPAATIELATADSLAAAFPAELEAAKAFGAARAGTETRRLAAETVVATIQLAARGKAPGPSGRVASLRCTHPLRVSFQYNYRKADSIVLVSICGRLMRSTFQYI